MWNKIFDFFKPAICLGIFCFGIIIILMVFMYAFAGILWGITYLFTGELPF